MHLGDPISPKKAVMGTEPAVAAAHQGGVNGSGDMIGVMMDADNNSSEEGKGEGEGGGDGISHDKNINFGGNRWPRQETLALLKIRSDMDAVFRDSSLKGPLWEQVSRKLVELGYHRSAKKCKEKFENVYKYHKRTKESRSGKAEGKKTYRFFDQLQALEKQFTVSTYQPKSRQPLLPTTTNTAMTLMPTTKPGNSSKPISYVTTTFPPSTNPTLNVISPSPPQTNATTIATPNNINNNNVPYNNTCFPNMNLFSTTNSTSSSTASDEDLEERYRKKRKWKDYFRRLTRQVFAKQEEMQKKFLEAIDKLERERVAQQEAWRMQEMARINREHEILVQERSTAVAKDAVVLAFLQKLSGPTQFEEPQKPQMQMQPQQLPVSQVEAQEVMPSNNFEIQRLDSGHGASTTQMPMVSSNCSSSRWPKVEIHALIRLRTSLEAKYQENGPKAPLWEEISAGMQRLGYNRSAKRCKEKWENINKYFKKVKESSKQRCEDSKTCPYFHELDALYKEKNKTHLMKPNETAMMMMMMKPLMVQPEQQWRPPPQYNEQLRDNASDRCQEKQREEEDGDDDIIEEEEEDKEDGDRAEDEEGRASRYEIGTNELSSVEGTVE